MVTFRDINLEDIPRALRLAGSPYRTLDRNDYAKAIKALEAGTGFGQDHLRIDEQDMSEALIGASGGFGGGVPDPTAQLDLTLPATAAQLTTTRASVGYARNSAGVYTQFANNIPRITDLGLLVEEARTNSIRNNSMQGAVAGTPGTLPTNWQQQGGTGLTRTIVGTGTENGIDYIDVRFVGTSGGSFSVIDFEAYTQIAATAGQVWTGSVFVKLLSGGANVTPWTLSINQSGGTGIGQTNFVPTSVMQRIAVMFTMPASVLWTWLRLSANYSSSGVPIDFTLRIGWPQLELGAFATSPIRTTTAAVTRQADLITAAAPAYAGEATLFVEGVIAHNMLPVSQHHWLVSFAGAVAVDDEIGVRASAVSNVFTANVAVATVSQMVVSAGTQVPGQTFKLAVAAKLNNGAFAANGGTPAPDAAMTMPAALTKLQIGSRANNTFIMNGYIKRVAYWPTRLTNAQLRTMTG